MIITTIAGTLYEGESDLFHALSNIINKIPEYLETHRNTNGDFVIKNPTDHNENFADKWIEHPDRKDAFIQWTHHLKEDLVPNKVLEKNQVALSSDLKKIFGDNVENAFDLIGQERKINQKNGTINYNMESGLSFNHSKNNNVPKNNFWGNNDYA